MERGSYGIAGAVALWAASLGLQLDLELIQRVPSQQKFFSLSLFVGVCLLLLAICRKFAPAGWRLLCGGMAIAVFVLWIRQWVIPFYPEFVAAPALARRPFFLGLLLYGLFCLWELRKNRPGFSLFPVLLLCLCGLSLIGEMSETFQNWRDGFRWTGFWGIPEPIQSQKYFSRMRFEDFEDGVVRILEDPSETSFVIVLLRNGKIFRMNRHNGERSLLGSIPLKTENESGMYSMAFHPRFSWKGPERRVFFRYSKKSGEEYRNILAQYEISKSGFLDNDSQKILIEQPHHTPFHFGGGLLFSPGGLLFTSFGDAQMTYRATKQGFGYYGTLLRLDVDCSAGRKFFPLPASAPKYSHRGDFCIPFDNPFAQSETVLPEIFAFGFRNPFRFSIYDEQTLVVADVGDELFEEINWVTPGGNYGWPGREARISLRKNPWSESENEIYPAYFYPHTKFREVIIGGPIYRGIVYPELTGKYVFIDAVSGELFAASNLGPKIRSSDVFSVIREYVISVNEIYGEIWSGDAKGKIWILTHSPPRQIVSREFRSSLFEARCVRCHGERGVPEKHDQMNPPDLSSPQWHDSLTNEEIENIIRFGSNLEGVHPFMPPWGQVFDRPSISELRKEVRALRSDRG